MEPLDGGIRGRSRPLAGDISPGEGAEILPVNFKTKEPPRKICGSSPEFVYKLSHPPPPSSLSSLLPPPSSLLLLKTANNGNQRSSQSFHIISHSSVFLWCLKGPQDGAESCW